MSIYLCHILHISIQNLKVFYWVREAGYPMLLKNHVIIHILIGKLAQKYQSIYDQFLSYSRISIIYYINYITSTLGQHHGTHMHLISGEILPKM